MATTTVTYHGLWCREAIATTRVTTEGGAMHRQEIRSREMRKELLKTLLRAMTFFCVCV